MVRRLGCRSLQLAGSQNLGFSVLAGLVDGDLRAGYRGLFETPCPFTLNPFPPILGVGGGCSLG
jgi:hypothetical protein